ncbi:MAG: hypothetical protein H6824_13875 [Planctomycetaceae bacterium]|nr:hypothetical protein [Planctomycetaceae bacterium]
MRACSECQQWLQQLRHFDSKVSAALADVPIPEGLEARLLAAIESESAAAAPVVESPRRRSFTGLRVLLTLSAAILLGLVWWLSVPDNSPVTFEFAELQTRLQQDYSQVAAVEALPVATDLDCATVEGELRRLRLHDPRGLQLDSVAGSDAAAYAFRYKQWSGVVIAIPTHRLQNGPSSTAPVSGSRQRSFAWQSRDQQWAYVCYVNSGPAEGFMRSVFGSMV